MKKAIFNRETLKLELHFDKADYQALTDAEKSRVKSAFLWSRSGAGLGLAIVAGVIGAVIFGAFGALAKEVE